MLDERLPSYFLEKFSPAHLKPALLERSKATLLNKEDTTASVILLLAQ